MQDVIHHTCDDVIGIPFREFELAFISTITMKVIQSSSLRELRAFLEKTEDVDSLV